MALSGRLRKLDLEMYPDGIGERRGEGFSIRKWVCFIEPSAQCGE